MPETVLELDRDTVERLQAFATDGEDRAATVRRLLARTECSGDAWPPSDYY